MTNIKGHVDLISRTEVRGWAVDAAALERRLRVELLSSGHAISASVADMERADLISLGLGRTDFAFSITIPDNEVLDFANLSVRADGSCPLPVPPHIGARGSDRKNPAPSPEGPSDAHAEPTFRISSEVADALRGSIDFEDGAGIV